MTTALNTDRRSVLEGCAAELALAAPVAASRTVVDRRAWEAAVSAFEKASDAAKAYDVEFFRVYDAWKAGQPSMEGIHWREFKFADRNNIARALDLDEAWQHFLDGENKWWWGGSPQAVERMKARYRAALDSVQAYRDEVARHNRESGMDAAELHQEALSDALCEARDALMEMPAPDLAALRWKLDHLTDEGSNWNSWSMQFASQTLADIARLMPSPA